MLIIAMDTNFWLKRRAVSNDVRDPTLELGWGYFVEDHEYQQHIFKYMDQDDVSIVALLHVLYLLSCLDRLVHAPDSLR